MIEFRHNILGRLFLSWLLLSAVTGGGVYVYGMAQIDARLLSIATAESGKLSESKLALVNHPGAAKTGRLQNLVNEFAREHFVAIELYDRHRRMVAQDVNPDFRSVEELLQQHRHGFPFDDQPHYQRLLLDELTLLQTLVPLRDTRGDLAGYFEGVFVIDEETLGRLRQDVTMSLLAALAAVLIVTLALYPVIVALNRNVMHQSRNLLQGNIELMEVLGIAIAKRDSDTHDHNYRVSIYAARLGEAAGMAPTAVRDLVVGAFLHDVGKIGISDAILLKPGRIDEDEIAAMRNHVAMGVDIIGKSEWLQHARAVVEFHHEKFDGSGYPNGLAGSAIPISARVFAIVDVFDALTSKRPYKEPVSFPQTMAILREQSGRHFDPQLLGRFESIAESIYHDVGQAGEARVESMFRRLIVRYFIAAAPIAKPVYALRY